MLSGINNDVLVHIQVFIFFKDLLGKDRGMFQNYLPLILDKIYDLFVRIQ